MKRIETLYDESAIAAKKRISETMTIEELEKAASGGIYTECGDGLIQTFVIE